MVLDLTGTESEELQAAAWRFVWTVTQGKGWNREVAVGLSAAKRLAVSITSSFLTDGDQAESCGQEQLLIQAFSNCTVSYNKKRERTGWCNFFLTWFFSAVNGFGMQISNFCSNHSRDSRTGRHWCLPRRPPRDLLPSLAAHSSAARVGLGRAFSCLFLPRSP